MPPSSLTLNYDAIQSTALFNWAKGLEDQVSKSSAFFYKLKKSGAWQGVESIGDRMALRLMYDLGTADSYSSYDELDLTPMDGITSAFYNWAQMSVPITISGLEEKKTTGENSLANLLDDKTQQAKIGIMEFFNRSLLQGAGGSSITTAYTSPSNGSTFIDPLPLLIKYDPTSSTVIGNINQSTATNNAGTAYWRNQFTQSGATTYAGFMKELRTFKNNCGKGPGGNPDLYLSDQHTAEFYEAALASMHQNPSYQKADIPFDNVQLFGQPLTWDELVPDVAGGSITQSTSSGTLWGINTKFFKVKYHKGTNFATTPFQKPVGQDAKSATILWLGGVGVSNRRKQGVMGSIDTTVTS